MQCSVLTTSEKLGGYCITAHVSIDPDVNNKGTKIGFTKLCLLTWDELLKVDLNDVLKDNTNAITFWAAVESHQQPPIVSVYRGIYPVKQSDDLYRLVFECVEAMTKIIEAFWHLQNKVYLFSLISEKAV